MIDREMQKTDKCKQQRLTIKSQVDDFEGQINEIKKRLNTQNKEIAAQQKQVAALETRLEQKRADRHSLLKTCKVNLCIFTARRRLFSKYDIYDTLRQCHLTSNF